MACFIRLLILIALVVSSCAGTSHISKDGGCDSELNLAVVREVAVTADKMAKDFKKRTKIHVCITTGEPGELVDKIRLGAEYDVFMAADMEHLEKLVSEGFAGQETIYALGTIALYSTYWKLYRPEQGMIYIWSDQYKTLAVPDPEKSLYGKAAAEIIKSEYGLSERIGERLFYAGDAVSTLELVESKQADTGLVAYPDLSSGDKRWVWLIPESMYEPIEQGAVVLTRAKNAKPAQLWMEYIQSDAGKAVLKRAGYRLPGGNVAEDNKSAKVEH